MQEHDDPNRRQDTLWTVGHSTRDWEDFVALLRDARIEVLVDVRRHAGSRRHPQFFGDTMARALPAAGIDYVAMPGLGGRRPPRPDSPNGAWRNASFRGYADNMDSPEWRAARDRLAGIARECRTAMMCAEAVWWRCHRRLIADDFTARGWQVVHLMAPGRSQPHALNPDARMVGDVLRYPAPGGGQAELFG